MPIMDGYEASMKIREIENISNRYYYPHNLVGINPYPFRQPVPIIAMTAYAQDSDKQKCLAAGMSDYIKYVGIFCFSSGLSYLFFSYRKPIQRRLLLSTIQKWAS